MATWLSLPMAQWFLQIVLQGSCVLEPDFTTRIIQMITIISMVLQAFKDFLVAPTLNMHLSSGERSFSVLRFLPPIDDIATDSSTNPVYRYADCAYVEMRTSNDLAFDPYWADDPGNDILVSHRH